MTSLAIQFLKKIYISQKFEQEFLLIQAGTLSLKIVTIALNTLIQTKNFV